MEYIKNNINTFVIKKTREYIYPASSRYFSVSIFQNNNVVYSNTVNDISPYPDSYIMFTIDDNVANLNEGVAYVTVYEVSHKFFEFVINVKEIKSTFNIYNNNIQYNIYNN